MVFSPNTDPESITVSPIRGSRGVASMVKPTAAATGVVRRRIAARNTGHAICIPLRCTPSPKKVITPPSEPDNHHRLLLLLQLSLQVSGIEIIAFSRVKLFIEFAFVEDIDELLEENPGDDIDTP